MTNSIEIEEHPTKSAADILQMASDAEQKIIKEILAEERKVIHQKYRNNIYVKIVGSIKRNVQ